MTMPVSADTLRLHLDYSAWATRLLLDAAAELPAAGWSHDFGAADRSVSGTLVHIFGADRIWLARVRGVEQPGRPGPEFEEIATLRQAWFSLAAEWRAWAETLSDEAALEVISYRDLKGNPWRTPLWQILLHVVNHATHHRSEIATMLTLVSGSPPPTDFVVYLRIKHGQAA
jgi:uncharacterized damage-inducible protein DinB